ncbi:hypothetical protein [Vibrio sp. D431a]|uniref:hypothetical protein n=1 Tax=Vibrio sp. D431a TaxID=2837388 RepID=UPI002555D06A|nr:hypothetical protein [Vibrio sp. D431a]MDK9793817.1 hypothetical protein [Vibrio sp. D431a]
MTPWFFSMPVMAVGYTSDGKLHLLLGDKAVDLCITIPTSGERGAIIGKQDAKTIDLYSYHLEKDKRTYLSRPIGRFEIMYMDEIQHVLPDESNEQWNYENFLEEDFEIEEPSNFYEFGKEKKDR